MSLPIDDGAITISASGRSRTCTARRRVGYSHLGSPMPSRRIEDPPGTGGIRTHITGGLSPAALPVGVPCDPRSTKRPDGSRTRISCLTTRRASHRLHEGVRQRTSGPGGIRTPNHLLLRQVALPLAYRAVGSNPMPEGGFEPTGTRGLSRAARPVGVLGRSSISSGGRNRTSGLLGQARRHYQQQLPRIDFVSWTRSPSAGSGRRTRTSTVRFKAGWPAVSRSPRVPCGSRTRLSGLGSRCLDRSAKGTVRSRGGRRGSRTPKAHRSAVFETAAIAQLACPSTESAPAAGIEPASSRLTAGRSVPARAPPESIQSGRPDSNRRSPGPEPGGLPGFPTPRPVEVPSGSRTRTSAMARRQAAATSWAHFTVTELSKRSRGHRVGLEPTPPHYGCGVLAAGRPVHATIRVGPEGLEPSPARLRAGCAAANTWVPASTTESVGPGGVEPPSPGYRPGALPLSYRPSRFPLRWGRRDSNPRRAD